VRIKMPQASEEQRKEWGGALGIGEDKAEEYLLSRGYKLTPGWLWILPTPEHKVTDEERGAIGFLVDEWDYGGYVKDVDELKKYEIKRTVTSSSTSDSAW
jgi:hypothetical protein